MSDEVNKCEAPGCEKTVKKNAWAQIKADNWLFMKDGKTYCPDHIPEWYQSWTRKRKEK